MLKVIICIIEKRYINMQKKWAYGRNPILELNENTTIAIAKEKYIYLLDTNFFIIVIC